jgi:hypothetical protein
MSQINVRLIPLVSGGTGTGSIHVTTSGLVRAIGILIGTLETPDVAITDGLTGAPVLSDTAIAANVRYIPLVPVCDASGDAIASTYAPPVITGRMDIAITGAGNNHLGQLVLVIER